MLKRARKFEIVSEKERARALGKDNDLYKTEYEDFFIRNFKPRRATKYSAAYDLYSPIDLVLKPGQIGKIPMCFKIKMPKNEGFFIYIRSSLGAKEICLPAGVNIIDSDYYNNEVNEGNFFVIIKNNGKEDFIIDRGDRIAQGVFQKYYKTKDDNVKYKRVGGLGHTGVK